MADADAREAGIAITVADDWQDKGIDEVLLSHLVDYAQLLVHRLQIGPGEARSKTS